MYSSSKALFVGWLSGCVTTPGRWRSTFGALIGGSIPSGGLLLHNLHNGASRFPLTTPFEFSTSMMRRFNLRKTYRLLALRETSPLKLCMKLLQNERYGSMSLLLWNPGVNEDINAFYYVHLIQI